MIFKKSTLIILFGFFAICCTLLLTFKVPSLHAQMPKGVPGVPYYAVRKTKPNAPCTFTPVYQLNKSNKSDPRIAFIELYPLIHADDAPVGFYGLCTSISQQGEDNLVVFDRSRAYLHILWGDPTISETIAYFKGTTKSAGVMLAVSRREDEWQAYVFAFRDNKWHDLTTQYLGQFHLGENDLIVVPQYGRTARVLTYDGKRFHHKLWLTWDGTRFKLSTANKMPAWRCPDSYRYFEPSDRAQYCR